MISAIVVGHNQFCHIIIDHHKSQNLLMAAHYSIRYVRSPNESASASSIRFCFPFVWIALVLLRQTKGYQAIQQGFDGACGMVLDVGKD